MTLKNPYLTSAIALAQNGLSTAANVNSLIQKKDYAFWEKRLRKEKNINSYLLNNKNYNLLNLSVVVGLHIAASDPNEITAHAKKTLEALDGYLSLFPELLTDKSFIHKLKNLEGMSFLSTLCELSLAKYFKEKGFLVGFETPFSQTGSLPKKNVDLSITDTDGNIFHFEVYMPANSTDIDGFFSPTEEDHHFEYKVMKKLEDKFGKKGIAGISGKVFLAINVSFYDDLRIRGILSDGNFDLFARAKKHLPDGVDGAVFFTDEFVNNDGAHLGVLIEK
jgi:hypothetical protein